MKKEKLMDWQWSHATKLLLLSGQSHGHKKIFMWPCKKLSLRCYPLLKHSMITCALCMATNLQV